MKPVLNGYSGKLLIQLQGQSEYLALLSSFNVVVNSQVLESNASNRIKSAVFFKNYGMNAVRDFPNYQLSISFQSHFDLFSAFMNKLVENSLNTPIKIVLQDVVYGMSYKFDECYIKSLTVSVENNNLTNMSLNLIYFKQDFELQQLTFNELQEPVFDIYINDAKNVMPYYNWMVNYDNYNNKNLLSLSYTFQRQITPVFGCIGATDVSAIPPFKLHFGLPKIVFQLNYLYNEQLLIENVNDYKDDYSVYGYVPANNCLSSNLSIIYIGSLEDGSVSFYELYFNRCVVTSYAPNLANSNSYNTITISGKVFGTVSNIQEII